MEKVMLLKLAPNYWIIGGSTNVLLYIYHGGKKQTFTVEIKYLLYICFFTYLKLRTFYQYQEWAIIILFVQVSNRNENSLQSNFLPQKVHKSFMCNVTDVKQTMAYLNFAFVTNWQSSVCPTVTKTTLIVLILLLDTYLKH